MFTVFASDGDRSVDGRSCFQWDGIPTEEEFLARVENSTTVFGIRIEMKGLSLSNDRIDVYRVSGTEGSYDGRTLRALMESHVEASDDQVSRKRLLTRNFGLACRLYFDIVHGRITGLHAAAQPVTPPGD